MNTRTRRPPNRRRQKGAALYVALMMLILLTLVGLVGLQVAGLQERMSANYQATNTAFQNAEDAARETENALAQNVADGIAPATNLPSKDCATAFDAQAWDEAVPHVRRLDECVTWAGIDMLSVPEEERTDQIYQITAFDRDRALNPTSEAVIGTVYIP